MEEDESCWSPATAGPHYGNVTGVLAQRMAAMDDGSPTVGQNLNLGGVGSAKTPDGQLRSE